jgi:hypothetical protein
MGKPIKLVIKLLKEKFYIDIVFFYFSPQAIFKD